MAVTHTAYKLALRNRAQTLTTVPAPAWAFEDRPFSPVAGQTYIQEQYVPATAPLVTLGNQGEIEVTGFYVLQVFAPSGTDTSKGLAETYANDLIALFPPGLSLTATNGQVVRVRTNPATYREQLRNVEGRSMIPVNIPFRVRTNNS